MKLIALGGSMSDICRERVNRNETFEIIGVKAGHHNLAAGLSSIRAGEQVLALGFCGGIDPALEVGDLFLPSEYYSGELDRPPIITKISDLHARMSKTISDIRPGGRPPAAGPVYSVESISLETPELLTNLRARGIHAIDMESAYIAELFIERKIEGAIVLTLSDHVFKSPLDLQSSGPQTLPCNDLIRRTLSRLLDCLEGF